MDFRHLIVTCLFSMLRLSFETQKIKENYAIFIFKRLKFTASSVIYLIRLPFQLLTVEFQTGLPG